jgi:RNA polymerase sigma-70 factor, ECF subfamily
VTKMIEMVERGGPDPEANWITQAQKGNKAAFGHLVERYRRLVVSVAYRQGLELSAAEDVAQETFLRAWLALPQYRPAAGSWRAWLCRIAINQAIDHHRRERPHHDLDEQVPDGRAGPAEQTETRARAQMVRQALDQLPPASRAALILSEYEALSYAEIAAALDIPMGTVMSRLNYARRRLRELLMEREEIR